jgi:thiol-disulfide isomerase/thioredoxin
MKILVTVHVPSENDIKDDPLNWDVYGAGEALDREMTKYPLSFFAVPQTANYAESLTKAGYKWQVVVNPNITVSPLISFYDVHSKNVIGTLEGTGRLVGEVSDTIKNLVGRAAESNIWDIALPVTSFTALLVAAFSQNKKVRLVSGLVALAAGGAALFRFLPRLKNSENTEGGKKEIFFFTADWCGACRELKPKIEAIASKSNVGIRYITGDDEAGKAAHSQFEIAVLPVIIVASVTTEGYEQLGRWDGSIDVEVVQKFID